ncbi:Dual specificity protein phosphatase 6 [Allomyces javanicus]|nr:Dual specificity protein phosphatase 6 [Allomyces javanicus]
MPTTLAPSPTLTSPSSGTGASAMLTSPLPADPPGFGARSGRRPSALLQRRTSRSLSLSLPTSPLFDPTDAHGPGGLVSPSLYAPSLMAHNLYLGSQKSMAMLLAANPPPVLAVLNVAEEIAPPSPAHDALIAPSGRNVGPPATPRPAFYLHLPMSHAPVLAEHLPAAIQFIDMHLSAGHVVLVHCMCGVSRSAAVVIAFLMWRARLSFRKAYEYVRARRPISPNMHLVCQLVEFAISLDLPPDDGADALPMSPLQGQAHAPPPPPPVPAVPQPHPLALAPLTIPDPHSTSDPSTPRTPGHASSAQEPATATTTSNATTPRALPPPLTTLPRDPVSAAVAVATAAMAAAAAAAASSAQGPGSTYIPSPYLTSPVHQTSPVTVHTPPSPLVTATAAAALLSPGLNVRRLSAGPLASTPGTGPATFPRYLSRSGSISSVTSVASSIASVLSSSGASSTAGTPVSATASMDVLDAFPLTDPDLVAAVGTPKSAAAPNLHALHLDHGPRTPTAAAKKIKTKAHTRSHSNPDLHLARGAAAASAAGSAFDDVRGSAFPPAMPRTAGSPPVPHSAGAYLGGGIRDMVVSTPLLRAPPAAARRGGGKIPPPPRIQTDLPKLTSAHVASPGLSLASSGSLKTPVVASFSFGSGPDMPPVPPVPASFAAAQMPLLVLYPDPPAVSETASSSSTSTSTAPALPAARNLSAPLPPLPPPSPLIPAPPLPPRSRTAPGMLTTRRPSLLQHLTKPLPPLPPPSPGGMYLPPMTPRAPVFAPATPTTFAFGGALRGTPGEMDDDDMSDLVAMNAAAEEGLRTPRTPGWFPRDEEVRVVHGVGEPMEVDRVEG